MNKLSYFIEHVPPYYPFFLGVLYSSLLSQANTTPGLIKLDFFILKVNPPFIACQHIQLIMSSLTFHLSSVEKKDVVSTSLSPSLET